MFACASRAAAAASGLLLLLPSGSAAAAGVPGSCEASDGCAGSEDASLVQWKKLSHGGGDGGGPPCLKDAAIVVIDMQNDFVQPTGTLSAGGGNKDVVEPINELLGLNWGFRAFTADNHPSNHVSFGVNHRSYQENVENGPFPIFQINYTELTAEHGPKICGTEYIPLYGDAASDCSGFPTASGEVFTAERVVAQETYPAHCVQGTWGQKIVPELNFSYNRPTDHLFLKGQNAHIDSYSAVFNNIACNGETTINETSGEPNSLACIPEKKPYPLETNLADLLESKGVKKVYFVGLCFDYCVKYSSIHTAFLGREQNSWKTYVIEDATRPCSPSNFHVSQSKEQMLDNGVQIIKMSELTR